MAEQWNRKQRRKMSRYHIGQDALNQGIDAAWKQAEETTYRAAFSGVFLALYEHFDFPAERLHELAVETMRNINGALCASELVEDVKRKTGFDVDQPLEEFDANVEIGAF